MADASNELGVVETFPSMHEKIVEVVSKKPTGKQASVENLLKAVASVLDVEYNYTPASPKTIKPVKNVYSKNDVPEHDNLRDIIFHNNKVVEYFPIV